MDECQLCGVKHTGPCYQDERQRFTLDPVCLIHGLKSSEHDCLYCCLCYRPLRLEECFMFPNGLRSDICKDCVAQERSRLLSLTVKLGQGDSRQGLLESILTDSAK